MSRRPACSRMRAPISGWRRISRHSAPPAGRACSRIASAIPSLPRSWRTPAAWIRSTRSASRPSVDRCLAGVGAHRARVPSGALVTQVERLGQQHHRGQQQLGGLAGRAAVDGVALSLLDRQAGVVGDRHQAGELGVVRAAAAERLIDRDDAENLPARSRSGSSSMSSGCQPSGPGVAAAGGVQSDRLAVPVMEPAGSQIAPSRSVLGLQQPLPFPPRVDRAEQHAGAPRRHRARSRSVSCAGLAIEQPDGHDLERQLGANRLGQRLEHRDHAVARRRPRGRRRACCAGDAGPAPRRRSDVRSAGGIAVAGRGRHGCGCARRAWPRRGRHRPGPAARRSRRRRRPDRSRR